MPISSLRNTFVTSYREFRNLRSLTMASLLAAIYAISCTPVLGRFVIVPDVIEIRFGFIVIAIAAALFGPAVAAVTAFLGDVIGALLFSGVSFFWGFTLNWVVLGIVYGLFFYKEKVTVVRVTGAMLFHTCAVNLLLTTKWLQMMSGRPFGELFAIRFLPNAIMLPVNMILLFFALRAVCAVYNRVLARHR